jgi:hypothetical protein
VTGATASTGSNPTAGSTASSTATCSSGSLLGGGALVTTDTGANRGNVVVQSSYPSGNSWIAVGAVVTSVLNPLPLGSGHSMRVTAYAICST